MPQETRSQLFIRLLGDARKTDRIITQIRQSIQAGANARRFRQLFVTQTPAGHPVDCRPAIHHKNPDTTDV